MIFKNAFIIVEFSDVFLKLKQNEIMELKSKVFCKLKFSSHTMNKKDVCPHTHTHTHTHTSLYVYECVHVCMVRETRRQDQPGNRMAPTR
jgi:hypothetical protein